VSSGERPAGPTREASGQPVTGSIGVMVPSAASISAAAAKPIPPTAAGALRFLSAATDQGLGSFHLAPGFSLVLPAGSTGSTYSAAVLVDVATGP